MTALPDTATNSPPAGSKNGGKEVALSVPKIKKNRDRMHPHTIMLDLKHFVRKTFGPASLVGARA
ncbi:MAG: hypothetical protein ABSB35_29330 [Bryobacteraceae bacterium]